MKFISKLKFQVLFCQRIVIKIIIVIMNQKEKKGINKFLTGKHFGVNSLSNGKYIIRKYAAMLYF